MPRRSARCAHHRRSGCRSSTAPTGVCFAVPMTGAMTPRQERAAATRQRLIDVAVHQFAAKPYNEVAVGEIAEQAGVAHGLLFHHFGNKRGIYLEAVREISHRLFE